MAGLIEIIDEKEQIKWLEGNLKLSKKRKELNEQKEKTKDAFEKIKKNHVLSTNGIKYVAKYIKNCIIQPFETEAEYWSISALPQNHMLRINIYNQEVFTLLEEEETLNLSLHIKLSSFNEISVYEFVKTILASLIVILTIM